MPHPRSRSASHQREKRRGSADQSVDGYSEYETCELPGTVEEEGSPEITFEEWLDEVEDAGGHLPSHEEDMKRFYDLIPEGNTKESADLILRAARLIVAADSPKCVRYLDRVVVKLANHDASEDHRSGVMKLLLSKPPFLDDENLDTMVKQRALREFAGVFDCLHCDDPVPFEAALQHLSEGYDPYYTAMLMGKPGYAEFDDEQRLEIARNQLKFIQILVKIENEGDVQYLVHLRQMDRFDLFCGEYALCFDEEGTELYGQMLLALMPCVLEDRMQTERTYLQPREEDGIPTEVDKHPNPEIAELDNFFAQLYDMEGDAELPPTPAEAVLDQLLRAVGPMSGLDEFVFREGLKKDLLELFRSPFQRECSQNGRQCDCNQLFIYWNALFNYLLTLVERNPSEFGEDLEFFFAAWSTHRLSDLFDALVTLFKTHTDDVSHHFDHLVNEVQGEDHASEAAELLTYAACHKPDLLTERHVEVVEKLISNGYYCGEYPLWNVISAVAENCPKLIENRGQDYFLWAEQQGFEEHPIILVSTLLTYRATISESEADAVLSLLFREGLEPRYSFFSYSKELLSSLEKVAIAHPSALKSYRPWIVKCTERPALQEDAVALLNILDGKPIELPEQSHACCSVM